MCGIFCGVNQAVPPSVREAGRGSELWLVAGRNVLVSSAEFLPKVTEQARDWAAECMARGPNQAKHVSWQTPAGDSVQLLSLVLLLRPPFTAQPVRGHGFVLQYNGELYNPDCTGNDTSYIMARLAQALESGEDRDSAVCSTLDSLVGEFAVVLTDLECSTIYFGKDKVGRRLLLFGTDGRLFWAGSVGLARAAACLECVGGVVYKYSGYTVTELTEPHTFDLRQTSKATLSLEERASQLQTLLLASCAARQRTIHPIGQDQPHSTTQPSLAVLFSGGLDCSVVAATIGQNYANEEVPVSVDLLTVGFENPRTGYAPADSPDRVLSVRSWFELCRRFGPLGITFRLVLVDVPYAEWLAHKLPVLSLILPKQTEMDLLIAVAFYFAARALASKAWTLGPGEIPSWEDFCQDQARYTVEAQHYTSPAKVLFSGLGADELFGGYLRHENIFNGLQEDSPASEILDRYSALQDLLQHDITVIYERNLGRDDRAMACWGKEVRYPFLDELVVAWALGVLEPQHKVAFEWVTKTSKKGTRRAMQFERKHVLREVCRRLGLSQAAAEAKRAIQFGAKSAKMEPGQSQTRGTDIVQ